MLQSVMAAQAVLIDTIADMKRALERRADASDSDETIYQPSNRGNKLKRKARFVHEGQLDAPSGPRVYKQKIEHAGHERYIISRNPPRLDEDGYELDDDEVDEEADAAAAESNPYAEIKLEQLFAPLTSVADLPTHITMSRPYLSNAIPRLTEEASNVLRKEKAALWRMKQLLTKFRGDETWMPCGDVETGNDILLFGANQTVLQQMRAQLQGRGKRQSNFGQQVGPPGRHGQSTSKRARKGSVPDGQAVAELDADAPMTDHEAMEVLSTDVPQNRKNPVDEPREAAEGPSRKPSQPESSQAADHNGPAAGYKVEDFKGEPSGIKGEKEDTDVVMASPSALQPAADPDDENTPAVADEKKVVAAAADDDNSTQPSSHRMTTRRQAQAASDQAPSTRPGSTSPRPSSSTAPTSSSSSSSFSTFIHPLFLVPSSARPDRDFGLPAAEAEETRKLLMHYVQKQEEVCRGSQKLYDGLLKADRLRRTVLRWATAEAHVGELSDGEDWYDKSEWGLDADLKKGMGDDDDDGLTGAAGVGGGAGGAGPGGGGGGGKKTRARRA